MSTQRTILNGLSEPDTVLHNDTPKLERAKAQWKNLFSKPIPSIDGGTQDQQIRKPSLLTRSNQRENRPWGDILTGKSMDRTRVYIQKVNGLSIDRRGGQ
jgi:hypothetical protein